METYVFDLHISDEIIYPEILKGKRFFLIDVPKTKLLVVNHECFFGETVEETIKEMSERLLLKEGSLELVNQANLYDISDSLIHPKHIGILSFLNNRISVLPAPFGSTLTPFDDSSKNQSRFLQKIFSNISQKPLNEEGLKEIEKEIKEEKEDKEDKE